MLIRCYLFPIIRSEKYPQGVRHQRHDAAAYDFTKPSQQTRIGIGYLRYLKIRSSKTEKTINQFKMIAIEKETIETKLQVQVPYLRQRHRIPYRSRIQKSACCKLQLHIYAQQCSQKKFLAASAVVVFAHKKCVIELECQSACLPIGLFATRLITKFKFKLIQQVSARSTGLHDSIRRLFCL